MSGGRAIHDVGSAEALAAGTAMLPPTPPAEPLATTLDDAHGIRARTNSFKLQRSSINNIDNEGSSKEDTAKLSPSAPIAPTLNNDKEESNTPPMARAKPTGARLYALAGIVTFSMIMSSACNMLATVSLPTIGVELGMEQSSLEWITAAFGLTNGCFLLLSGRLADVHGRKLVFLVGVSWFALWNLVGGFLNNGPGLVVTRALAGSGAAMSTPSAIGIIATNFHGRARSTAFACFSAGAPVGGGTGLVLGGLLTAYTKQTWRSGFWVISGLAAATAVVACFLIPPDDVTTVDRRIDWLGAALITVGLIFLQFVISDGQTAPQGWKTSYILALLIIGVLMIAAFFVWEHHIQTKTSRPPLMRLQLWTRAKGRLAAVYFIGFVTWMCFVSLFYHATLFYQEVQGASPIQAMLWFLPTTVSGVLCNVIVAWLIARVPTQWIICTGIVATGLASVLFAISPADVYYWRLPFNAMWLSVAGADFLMATGSIFVAALALPGEQSVAGALFQTLVQLGGSFGLALTSVISEAYRTKAVDAGRSDKESLLEGLHAAFWLGAGCALAALILAAVMLRGMGAIGKGGKKLEKEKEKGKELGPVRSATGAETRESEVEVEPGERERGGQEKARADERV